MCVFGVHRLVRQPKGSKALTRRRQGKDRDSHGKARILNASSEVWPNVRTKRHTFFAVLKNLPAEVLAPPSQHRSIVTVRPNDVCMPWDGARADDSGQFASSKTLS